MNENAKQWVAALRSGEYKQGRNALKTAANELCCLGVACEISGLGEWDHQGYHTHGGSSSSSVLPRAVVDWLGINSTTGDVPGDTLSAMNDSGASFDQIADIIEKNETILFK